MTDELSKAQALFDSGDPQGAMRALRLAADTLPSAGIAPLVGMLAKGAGFGDLAEASASLVANPEGAPELYEFGYVCVERGISALAVPALREALQMAQQPKGRGRFGRKRASVAPRQVLVELAVALEDGERHAEAARLLQEHDGLTADWPDRYLLAHNALMAGQVDVARQVFDALTPASDTWRPAADRIRRTLAREALARPTGGTDLRGWHFTLTGGLLTTISPYGFEQAMTGRWAYLQDTFDSCGYGLRRLRVVLEATGARPGAVGLLPDRASRALGLAAARLLGVPAAPHRPGAPDTLVVAYDLNACDQELVKGLHDRAPGQILFEHATCWTDAPAVSADVSTLLVQTVVAPWEPGVAYTPEGERADAGQDERSPEELASAIGAAAAEPDEGDGGTPADGDEALGAFAARMKDTWLAGPRDRIRSSGPVRSARFS